MVNYLNQLQNPQFNHRNVFEVMRDFRKGGLNPSNFEDFMDTVNNLPPINKRTSKDFEAFEKFGLTDVTQADFPVIMREVFKRVVEQSKTCWHPLASSTTCKVDSTGKIISSAAHSIQNNGILNQIAEDGHVLGYALEEGRLQTKKFGKNAASIFWGFCNTHDAIFRPVETAPYTKTDEQNFLFAYRGFVVAMHKKVEVSKIVYYGEQADNDMVENKKLFDQAIITSNYSCIETTVIELPAFYPVATSSCFYLDYDFEGNLISHSDERMEYIFVTLLPSINKTYFLLSYLKQDAHLYSRLGAQLIARNNLKSDISVLLIAHTENIYFNPTYYKTFIEKQESAIERLGVEAQIDLAQINDEDEFADVMSITPNDYLSNRYEISLFGY